MGPTQTPFWFSLCADDYGLSPGISRGILEAIAAGRLSATSVLVTRPSWPEAARALAESHANERADIGLHLNLTLGRPLAPMPAFAGSGHFPEVGKIVMGALKHELPEAEIRKEISNQVDAFCQAFGAAPDFVDGHHHVHVLPQVSLQLFQSLADKGLQGKVWLRDSGDRVVRMLRRGRGGFKKSLGIAWLARGFASQAEARGFRTNDGFAGFSEFDASPDYGAEFARYLRAPGKRHLVMCHPGYCDELLAAADPATLSRERELRFLLSPAFADTLARAGAKLARLSSRL